MTETITIRKGDDEQVVVSSIKDTNENEYALQNGDYMVLTVRETPSKDSPVLLESSTTTMYFNLTHEQTSKILPGKYSCDIELFVALPNNKYWHRTIYPDDEYIEEYGKIGGEKNWKNFIVNAEVGLIE